MAPRDVFGYAPRSSSRFAEAPSAVLDPPMRLPICGRSTGSMKQPCTRRSRFRSSSAEPVIFLRRPSSNARCRRFLDEPRQVGNQLRVSVFTPSPARVYSAFRCGAVLQQSHLTRRFYAHPSSSPNSRGIPVGPRSSLWFGQHVEPAIHFYACKSIGQPD